MMGISSEILIRSGAGNTGAVFIYSKLKNFFISLIAVFL
jgi:hypothetical protein